MVDRIDVTPGDTLFFGDGRPFHGADEGLAYGRSRFPPLPRTMVGAVRSALAVARGWDGGEWTEDLLTRFGDHDGLGEAGLKFAGPFLIEETGGGDALWLPMPRSVLRMKEDPHWDLPHDRRGRYGPQPIRRLRPDPAAKLASDSGALHPPLCRDAADFEEFEQCWIAAEALDALLRDPAAEEIGGDQVVFAGRDALTGETRTGLALDWREKAAISGRLYTAGHVRLRDGFRLSLLVADGAAAMPDAPATLPHGIGGEGRPAWYAWRDDPRDSTGLGERLRALRSSSMLGPAAARGGYSYAIHLLTPALLESSLRPGAAVAGDDGAVFPGTLVSACSDRAIAVGGWRTGWPADTSDQDRSSVRANVAGLAAGTVLFMKETRDLGAARWPEAVGSSTEWGFGQYALGVW